MLSEHLLCVRQSSRPEDDTNGSKLNSSCIINKETKMNKACGSSEFYKHINRVRWQWLGTHFSLGWWSKACAKWRLSGPQSDTQRFGDRASQVEGGARTEAQRVAFLRWEPGSVWTELSDGRGEQDGIRLKRWMETVSFRALGPWPRV